MSFLDPANQNSGTGLADIATALINANKNSSLLIQTLQAIFPRITGTITLTAAATKTVADTNIAANSIVVLFPINASAGTLQGSAKSLYHDMSANVAGASFTVKTASGVAAAGGEQFSYFVVNPV